MSERRLEPRTCVITWTTAAGHLVPADLIEILERVHRYACDSLPGSVIVAMTYDGMKLEITLREAS